MKKRLLAFLLVLVMVVGFVPVTALAEGDDPPPVEPAADAVVNVTISNAGVLALADKPVTVKDIDQDGQLTYDEALVAAHTAYYSGGAAGYSASSGMVRTLWGVDADGNCLFVLNNEFIRNGVSTDTVKAGDYLVASIMCDVEEYYYTDYYAYYTERNKTVTAGEAFTLTLTLVPDQMMGCPAMASTGLQAGIWANGAFTAIDGAVADGDGKVTLTFAEAGTYIMSAAGTVSSEDYMSGFDCPIIAPVCTVTVEQAAGPAVIAEGTCGATEADNVNWVLTDDGVLTISGAGDMANFASTAAKAAPWIAYKDQITKIVIAEGVTKVGNYAFRRNTSNALNKVTEVTIPTSVTAIGNYAFNSMSALATVYYGGYPALWAELLGNLGSNNTSLTDVQNVVFAQEDPPIVSLEISGAYKTEYDLGMAFDPSGIVVKGMPAEGKGIDVTDRVTFSGFDSETLGEKTITVTLVDGENTLTATFTVSVVAFETAFSGTCGAEGNEENVTWALSRGGTLTISGSGAMADYSGNAARPYADYAGQVYAIVVNPGVTTIGKYAFNQCSKATSISLPATLTSIGVNAMGYTAVEELFIPEGVKTIGDGALAAMKSLHTLHLPSTLESVGGANMMNGSDALQNVYYGGDEITWLNFWTTNTCRQITTVANTYIEGPQITSFTVTGYRTEWYRYENFVVNGSEIIATMSNDVSGTIPNNAVTAVSFDNESAGEKTVVLGYRECRTQIQVTVLDEVAIANGGCGDKVTWTLKADGTLLIRGEGPTSNFPSNSAAAGGPWRDVRELITSVVIGEGVTYIGSNSFYCTSSAASNVYMNIQTVFIPRSVTNIGAWFFGSDTVQMMPALETVYYEGTEEEWGQITGLSAAGNRFVQSESVTIVYQWVAPAAVVAEGDCGAAETDNVHWVITDDGVMTFSGTGAMADYYTSSDQPWADYRDAVRTAVIGEGVTTIGESALSAFTEMVSVSIAESVTSIGRAAFLNTGLTTVTLPKNVTSVGSQCFDYCNNLTTMVYDAQADLGNTGVGTYVNNISHLILGPNCTVWPGTLINKLKKTLETIEIDENNTYFNVIDNVIYVDEGKTLLAVLPTFSGVLNVPEGVTAIGAAAAQNRTAITGLTLPSTLTRIEKSAFDGCSNLAGQLDLPAGLTSLATDSFKGTAISGTVTIPASVTQLGAAFQQCKQLEEAIFLGSMEELPNNLFSSCTALHSVTLPEGLTVIGAQAFSACYALQSIDLPDTLESIGSKSFYKSGLVSVTLPDSVTALDTYTFGSCTSLTYLDLGNGITVIPTGLTSGSSGLVDFIVPAGVTSYNDSHAGCTQLTRILFRGTEEQWNAIEMSSTVQRVMANKTIIFNYDPEAAALGVTITQQPVGASYAWGAIAAPLEIAAEAEEGTTLSYVWFMNTTDSTEGGSALDYSVNTAGGSKTPVYYSAPGTYYYYCAVTAVKDGVITTVYSDVVSIEITGEADVIDLPGSGAAGSPYMVSSAGDLMKISGYTLAGHDFQGEYIKVSADITLPAGWTPIGALDGSYNSSSDGVPKGLWRLFRGNIDGGGHTITVPEGGRPLIGAIGGGAAVNNFKVYGKKIAGAGLVDLMPVMGSGAVQVKNITILSGTSTLRSGIINGGGRSTFTLLVADCTVENNVTVGYDRSQNMIGSIAGTLCGKVENCVSYADVYGAINVGGIVGLKGQSMAMFEVNNCQFHGTVTGTGINTGGIVGSGYYSTSAPNTAGVYITGCVCDGTVTGVRQVGGILGAEAGLDQAWDNGPCIIRGNTFTGTVDGQVRVGSIVGFLRSMNRYVQVEGNTGAAPTIGFVTHIDTSAVEFGMHDGTFYFNTANFNNYTQAEWKQIYDVVDADWTPGAQYAGDWAGQDVRWHNASIARANHNRFDDPLGVGGGGEVTVTSLAITGEYKTEYLLGEEFDKTGITVTATFSDNTTKDVTDETEFTGFDSSSIGSKKITAVYGGAFVEFTVNVSAPAGETIKVRLSILGADHHDPVTDGWFYTLKNGNLITWLEDTEFTVDGNATVWDLLQKAFEENGFTFEYNTKNGPVYISSVTFEGLTLREFDNYPKSGWQYTINGHDSTNGVDQQYLAEGDVICFHWTDDYTQEDYGGQFDDQQAAFAVEDLIDAIGTPVTLESENAIIAARTAYDALTMAQQALVDADALAALEAAEAALAALKESAAKVADVIEKINAIPEEITLESETVIAAARTAFDALTEAEQAQVTNADKLTAAEARLAELKQQQADQAAADAVIGKIAAIGEVTLESETAINEARAAYDALTDAQKALVSNYETLTAAETRLAELKEQQGSEERIAEATTKIDAIPEEITLESEEAIVAARAAYDALTDEEKAQVNADKLIAAEQKLAELKEQQASAERIAEANTRIAAIPEEITLESEEAIVAARAAYDALTDAQKAQITNYDKLVEAEKKLAELKFAEAKTTVKAVNLKNGTIKLTWTAIEGAKQYKVLVATSKTGTYKLAGTVTGKTFTYKKGTVGKACYFKVVGVNAEGTESAESKIVSKYRLPGQVGTLKVKSEKAKQVTLTWKKVTGAKKYFVYMSKNGKTGWKKIGTATTNKFTYKKGTSGKTLYFKVQAVTSTGKKGEFSAVKKCKVK